MQEGQAVHVRALVQGRTYGSQGIVEVYDSEMTPEVEAYVLTRLATLGRVVGTLYGVDASYLCAVVRRPGEAAVCVTVFKGRS